MSRVGGRQAVFELNLDEPHEEGIERTASGQELLSDLPERPPGRDHAREGGHLTAGTLDVPHGGSSVRVTHDAHGDTYAAPVIPEAA